MTWNELKTGWTTALAELAVKVSDFEFGFYMDQAQELLAGMIPQDLCQEMVHTEYTVTAGINLALPVEEILEVYWDDTDYDVLTHPEPIYRIGKRVNHTTLVNSVGKTNDRMWAYVSGNVELNQSPGVSATAGTYNVSISYKAKPTSYQSEPTGSPDLNERWHEAMLDHALSQVMLKLGDKDRSQLYSQAFMTQLQAKGLTKTESAQ